MSTEGTEHYRHLELRARRKVGRGVLHPDRCPKLTLHGVAFAIPPRKVQVSPNFSGERVSVLIAGLDEWPEAETLLELAPLRKDGACPTCGRAARARLEADTEDSVEFLAACFELAGGLLDRQYELTSEDKAALLAFEPCRPPEWIVQLLQWCQALPTTER